MTNTPSIYKSAEAQARCLAVYAAALAHWPVPFEQIDVPTRFGCTRVVASGPVDAPPLVLLHGQWSTATMWAPAVAALSRQHRTLAVDQIDDVGLSTPTRLPTGRPDYADWLADVWDQLRLERADVAGLSYGGFLATNFALRCAGRVSRLVLFSPGLPLLGPPTLSWALHGLPVTLWPNRLTTQWLVAGMSVNGYRAGDLEAEQLVASGLALRSRIPIRPVFDKVEFAQLQMPVLLLIGSRETLYDPKRAVEQARRLFPHLEAEIIPQAGHRLLSDRPGEALDRVARFLQA